MKIVFLREEEREELVRLVVRARRDAHDEIERQVPDSDGMRVVLQHRRLLGRILDKLAWGRG